MSIPEIRYIDVQERFGMGGPYLGKILIDGEQLLNGFLADNHIISADYTMIVFNRYHHGLNPKKSWFGYLREKRCFDILVWNIKTNIWMKSNMQYSCLFLMQLNNNEIEFCEAFHAGLPKQFPPKILKIDSSNFAEVNIASVK